MKRVLLFGRAGSGKSTIATMLYKGYIDETNEFNISDDVNGATIKAEVRVSVDREWEIYDTVGLGEPIGGSVPDKVAKKMLIELLKKTNHGFDYICMLKKEARFDEVDNMVIAFIYTLFDKRDLNTNLFYIIVSENDHWVEKNKNYLNKFINTNNAIAVNFPGLRKTDCSSRVAIKMQDRTRNLVRLKSLLHEAKVQQVFPRTTGFTKDIDYAKLSAILSQILSGTLKALCAAKQLFDIINIIDNLCK